MEQANKALLEAQAKASEVYRLIDDMQRMVLTKVEVKPIYRQLAKEVLEKYSSDIEQVYAKFTRLVNFL